MPHSVPVSYFLAFMGFVALIVLHEAGHFVAAKAVGMRVERFSLFFGPMFVKKTIGETEYGIGVLPLGGYVKITGMNPEEEIPPEAIPRAYYNQPVWKRIVVIAAGPLVNLVLAFVILWALFLGTGEAVTNAKGQPVVTNEVVAIEHPSAAAGVLRLGDEIVSIDGVKGDSATLRNVIGADHCAGIQVNGCLAAKPVTIVVRRDGRLVTATVRPRYSSASDRVLVGFDFGEKTRPAGALQSASLSVTGMWNVTKQTVSTVGRIFEAKERRQLQGVVGVYAVTQEAINASPSYGLQILALISLSLGVINLFPFLPLDGGHIFWAVAEKLRGRRIPFDVMERAGFVGFALILVLFVIGLSNSISTLSGKGFGVH
jgi:regulator of sigma E protease